VIRALAEHTARVNAMRKIPRFSCTQRRSGAVCARTCPTCMSESLSSAANAVKLHEAAAFARPGKRAHSAAVRRNETLSRQPPLTPQWGALVVQKTFFFLRVQLVIITKTQEIFLSTTSSISSLITHLKLQKDFSGFCRICFLCV